MIADSTPCLPKPFIYLAPRGEKAAVIDFSPKLARQIGGRNGDRLAILLIQLTFWIANDASTYFKDGHWWFAISAAEIHRRLHQWLSPSTFAAYLQQLKTKHLILLESGKCASDPYAIALDTEGCRKLGITVSETQKPANSVSETCESNGAGIQNSEGVASKIQRPVEMAMVHNGSGFRVSESIENYDGDDRNNLSLLEDHQHRVRARELALTKAGIQPASWKYFEGWSAEEINLLYEQSAVPGILCPAGFMVNQAKHPQGLTSIRQQMETRRQFEAMLKQQNQVEQPSSEDRVQLEALQAIARHDYEQQKADYEALLTRAEKVEHHSFWWNKWWLTVNCSLQAQLHKATLNSWIVGSEAIGLLSENGQQFLIVRVRSHYAQEWLDQRLYRLMQGVLATNSGQPDIQIKFVSEPVLHQPFEFQPLSEGIPGLTDKRAS